MTHETQPEYHKWLNLANIKETDLKNALTEHIANLIPWLKHHYKDADGLRRSITRFLTYTNKHPSEIVIQDFAEYLQYVYVHRTRSPKTLSVYTSSLRTYMDFIDKPEWKPLIRMPFATRAAASTTKLHVSPEIEQFAQDIWNDWLDNQLKPMQRTDKTIHTYKYVIIPTMRLLHKPPNEITKQDLLTVVKHMTDKHCKPQTINITITILRQLCNYHNNLAPFKSWKPLTPEAPVRRYPTKEQLESILALAKTHTEPYLYPFMMTLGFTGLRITTLCDLSIDEVNLDTRLIHTISKRKKSITAPINKKYLLPILTQYINNNGINHGNLWMNSRNHPVRPWMIRNFLHSITNAVGYWSPHDFRRGIATLLYRESKYDLRFVQQFLGHESINMTAKYIGIDDTELKEHYDTIITKLDFNV